MGKGKKKKQHTASTPNTIKISINREAPETYITPIRMYLTNNYGGFTSINQFYYDDGGMCLVVEMNDIHMAVRAARDNPHTIRGLKFAVRHQGAQSVGSSSSRSSQDQYAESECDRILATIPKLQTSADIGEQMRYVYHALALSDEDHETRQEFIQRFEAKCRSSLHYLTSSCYLYAFGSSVNKLGMKNCDLDLVLLTNGAINEVWDGELPDAKKLLVTIKGMMYREQYNFGISKIVPIPQARIPVIKFRHEPTMMDCDISFNKRTGVLNTRLLRHIMEFSETARILCFTIRLWGKQKNFVGGGGQKINSYTITLMTIFYLQQRDILPPLSQLKRSDNTLQDPYTDGECFVTDLSEFNRFTSSTQHSMATLLLGFLEFYIRFPFESQIISVLHGKPIPCKDIEFNTQLINVQDPFEMSYNTAKGVREIMAWWFRRCLCDAWQFPSLFEPTSGPHSWGLQYLFHYEDMPKKAARNTTPLYIQQTNQIVTLSPKSTRIDSPELGPEPSTAYQNIEFTCTTLPNPTPIIQKGSGKPLSLEFPIPCDTSASHISVTDRYTQVCSAVCQVLTGVFGMEVTAPVTDHPVSQCLYSQQMSRKRSHSPHNQTLDQADNKPTVSTKQTPAELEDEDITEIPVRKKPKSDQKTANIDMAEGKEKAVVEIVDLTDMDEDNGKDVQESGEKRATPTQSKDDVPVRYFLPYTIQTKSKHHVFRDTEQLNFLTFNYDSCVQSISAALSKEQTLKSVLEKINFTASFQPKDKDFKSIRIEFNDVYTQQFETLYEFLARLLPVSIQRRIQP